MTYLRSSSEGTFSFCEQKYFLTYVLGIREKTGWKAERGNMVHKALELLARRKVAVQNGHSWFSEDETGRTFTVNEMTPDFAAKVGFSHYQEKNESERDWTDKDFEDVRRWTWDLVMFRGGAFDPGNRKVIAPEQYFDFTIDEPWATYCYKDPHTGKELGGRLAIKGTVDLVTEVDINTIEYIDYKTGKRWDWGKDYEKSPEKLQTDSQLLLYYYALTRLFPKHKNIFVTIFYIQDGGPFTIHFERDIHVPLALRMLRKKFDQIRQTMVPKRIIADKSKQWKCFRLCDHHAKKWPGTEMTVCDFIHKETISIGLDRVVGKYGTRGAFSAYGEGGGRSSTDKDGVKK